MERSKWILIITLAFLLATLPVTLRNLKSNLVIQCPYLGDVTNVILGKLEGWSLGNQLEVTEEKIGGIKALGPNLTTCHPSFGRDDLLVHCCPPAFETPVPYVDFLSPDPQSPVRVRRPAHLVDENYIAKYNKALSIMKSLPYDDPRSFARQANLHCLFCTGAYDQQNSNAPLSIHRTWLFFPWHRMMIYFHERIIGSLIGDDTFALPYWAWDIPEGMVIPDMYMNKNSSFFHTERDVSHFSPKIVDLNYAYERNLSPEEQLDTNLAFMYNQMVSGARKMELFMGCIYKAGEEGYCNAPGTVELAPHNTLHTWVGSNLNPGREDMGKFYSAARDPIFYAHHPNIDRLWEVWREIHQNQMDIKDPDWLDSFFFFYDENLKLVKVEVRDVLDITKLGYSYEQVDRPWMNKRPMPSVPPKLARQILKANENKLQLSSSNHVSSSDFRSHGRALDASLTVKVNRTRNHLTKSEKEEEEVIVVHGIEVKGDAYVKFDVYVNVADETIITPKFREFAGTFAHIPGGGEMMRRKTDLKLGVSELLEDLEADQDESIWITLLPRTASCSNVTIGGVRTEHIR
ncbi:aureusidin synthase-like [Herrania umbratica]|uniref:Aureusidin synthase-like n=1 Tax=Herrania umbratica TaxID=108875 RepID=A0A6J1AGY1_9ROSI|nr:aureusidin synthase-like [Herrania umbratica]XP_021286223.1 aureusidin synthase-like [Herrania umbratica]